MSKIIATAAIRGAHKIFNQAEAALADAISKHGKDTKIEYPNTAYYLPIMLLFLGQKVERLGDLQESLDEARKLLHPVPTDEVWLPSLGDALDSGVATLIAEETIEVLKHFNAAQKGADGIWLGFTDDAILRLQGIKLVDGRMPGFAAIVGCAKSNAVAVKIVRELQKRNILTFLCGNVNGRSIIDQLQEEGVELGYDTYTVPFGTDTISAIYPLGFASRSALTFGGLKAGQAREILMYRDAGYSLADTA